MANMSRKTLDYCEGQSLESDELVLFALYKVTACPHPNDKGKKASDHGTVLRWHMSLMAQTMTRIFHVHYDPEALLHYLTLSLDGSDRNTGIGRYDDYPRATYFSAYVDFFLGKCSYALVQALQKTKSHDMDVLTEAGEVVMEARQGKLSGLDTVKAKNSLKFGMLHLSLAAYPDWRHAAQPDCLLLWKANWSTPYKAEKVVRVSRALRWEVEVDGRVASGCGLEELPQPLTTQQQADTLINLVDGAYLCCGLPADGHDQVIRTCFQHGVLYSADGATTLARLDGDFIRAEACRRLTAAAHACSACGLELPAALARALRAAPAGGGDTFKAQSLRTISALNSQLGRCKKQLVTLWAQYKRLLKLKTPPQRLPLEATDMN